MTQVRVAPGKAVELEEGIAVENNTGNSIIVKYDDKKKSLHVVDCCLEEQGK